MDILWPAVGIGIAAVFFVFIVAQHWHRQLREQAWTVRHLARRIEDLEQMGDPDFRRRLGESAPVPLEQVFHFTFRLADRFWRDTLSLTDENRKFVRSFGSFVGSVKLERWRSHIVATVAEVLPDSGPASGATGWRTRSLDFYPGQAPGQASNPAAGESLTLWEVPLERANGSGKRPPSLELILRKNLIELRGNSLDPSMLRLHSSVPAAEISLLRVPLDPARLVDLRAADPLSSAEPSNGNGDPSASGQNDAGLKPSLVAWEAFFCDRDDSIGIEWELRVRDLTKKAEWERWKILDPNPQRAFF